MGGGTGLSAPRAGLMDVWERQLRVVSEFDIGL